MDTCIGFYVHHRSSELWSPVIVRHCIRSAQHRPRIIPGTCCVCSIIARYRMHAGFFIIRGSRLRGVSGGGKCGKFFGNRPPGRRLDSLTCLCALGRPRGPSRQATGKALPRRARSRQAGHGGTVTGDANEKARLASIKG